MKNARDFYEAYDIPHPSKYKELKEKVKQQQSELDKYNCFWKACVK